MIEKDYDELTEDDIWTTNGCQILFFAMKGKDGEVVEDKEPDEVDIFVPRYTIPDEFFER